MNPLDGARVPSGCEDCDAEQVIDATQAPIYRVTVQHDENCPAYLAMREKR